MAYFHPGIDALFLVSVAVLWAMIFYQLFYTFLGYAYRQRSLREMNRFDAEDDSALPRVSILIPAHNEELVIRRTLESIRSLRYPPERMEIVVVNDGSTDATASIVNEISREDARVSLFNVPPEEAAQGKSHALNLGARQARYDLIAVYDADNTPEPDSLRYLVLNLQGNPKRAAVFGKFRTRNKNRNLLTRFINLETLSFQFMVQAGRAFLFNIAILPGTNLVMRKSVWEEQGGWDEKALTEDTEFSIRLYDKGYEIKFVPYAVTWEEEPETWGTWFRQRTRWVRGNFYVLRKYFVASFRFGRIGLTFELIHLFLLYYLFLASILLSHAFFVACGLGFVAVHAPGPYFAVWICATLLFTAEIMIAASYENEATATNLLVTLLMYLTYCQAWLILVFRATYQECFLAGRVKWEKTRRFASDGDNKM